MSDKNDNNTGDMANEWARVSANPDNLIVSDVLRSALPDEFSESENISSVLEIAIEIGELEIVAPLTRLDMSREAWLCHLSVDASDAAVILSYSLDEIYKSKIELMDKGNTIRDFSIGENDNLSLSVDTDGRTYFITMACECREPPEKANEA